MLLLLQRSSNILPHSSITTIITAKKYLNTFTTTTTKRSTMARIMQPTKENLEEAAELVRGGGLVSFPTETVYGLGANALDEAAVLKIFHAKGRPLTDPVIGEHSIIILDGGETACGVGIESTVAKLVEANGEAFVEVLRRGGVSTQALTSCLTPHGIKLNILERKAVPNNTTVGMEAPGQLLTHYAPDKPAYITAFAKNGESRGTNSSSSIDLKKSILIDFGGALSALKDSCLAYKDLSPKKDIDEAANVLFSVLRWSETVGEAEVVLLPDLRDEGLENADAVFDRIFRAASGRTAIVDKISKKILI